jgi:hypothetical protein
VGIEALALVVWPFGVSAASWLIYRSFLPKSRPFALPTLVIYLASASPLLFLLNHLQVLLERVYRVLLRQCNCLRIARANYSVVGQSSRRPVAPP